MLRRALSTAGCGLFIGAAAADQMVAVPAAQDSFIRQLDPAANYGAGGLLCAAGVNSVNAVSQPRGRFDAVMCFDLAAAVASFDAEFGVGQWSVSGAFLQLAQNLTPDNPLFPRGTGDFAVPGSRTIRGRKGPARPTHRRRGWGARSPGSCCNLFSRRPRRVRWGSF